MSHPDHRPGADSYDGPDRDNPPRHLADYQGFRGRLRGGDPVTVQPISTDAYILHFQRYATVTRAVDGGYMVRIDATIPPDQEFGPIPPERLLPGWKDGQGRWR